MEIYYLNLFSVFIYGFFYEIHRTRQTRKAICILITVQLILITGLRKYTVGVDTPQYYSLFNTLNRFGTDIFWNRSRDKFMLIYKAVNYFVWKCGGSFQSLLLIMAAIAIIPVMYYIYNNSKNVFFSIFIYLSFNYYMYTLITLRQSAAYGIILLSIPAIRSRNLMKFLLLLVIAIGFHISAIFFLPAYWIYKIKINKITVIGFIVFGTIVWIFRLPLMNKLINFMFTDYQVVISNSVNYLIMHVLVIMFALVVRYFEKKNVTSIFCVEQYYKPLSKTDNYPFSLFDEDDFSLSLMMFGTILMIFCTVSSNALRITYFYTMQLVVLLPNMVKKIKNGKLIFMAEVICFIACIYVFTQFLHGFSSQNMEYVPFWR